MKSLAAIVLLSVLTANAGEVLQPIFAPSPRLEETRICGEPLRDSNGVIKRSSAVLTAYRKVHPCPVTGKSSGTCPGWAINHVIPLAKGGCDSVSNLQWLPDQVKNCSKDSCIDRWERLYYGEPHGILKPFTE